MSLRYAWLWLRSLVFWIWQITNTLIMGLPVLLGSAISFDVGYWLARVWLYCNLYGLRYICGVKWEVDGREHIPDTPCLVLSKHQSTWDTYFLPTQCYPALYVAKKSLRNIPIFGWALSALGFILIDRKAGRSAVEQMVQQSRNIIEKGGWVVIFPEGTRRPVGAEPSYRVGGAVVATRIPADVLPVALNAGEYWPRMGFVKWPGTIRVSFGPVIKAEGRKPDDVMADVQEWIETRSAEISDPDSPMRRRMGR